MRYKDAKSPQEYLEYVLSTWDSYIESNGGICRAIRDILEENQRLKNELEKKEKNS